MLRVRAPYKLSGELSLGCVGLGVAVVIVYAIGDFPRTVASDSSLYDGRVLLVFCRLPHVQGVHAIEVAALDIDATQSVGRDICPSRIFLLAVIGVPCEVAVVDSVFEMVNHFFMFSLSGLRGVFLFLSGPYVEIEIIVILRIYFEACHRNVLAVKRITGYLGNLHGQLLKVEDRFADACLRVGQIVLCPLRCLPLVYEPASIPQPHWSDLCGKYHFCRALSGKAFCKCIVGLSDISAVTFLCFLAGFTYCGLHEGKDCGDACRHQGCSFHISLYISLFKRLEEGCDKGGIFFRMVLICPCML